jgi:hypothetical protein
MPKRVDPVEREKQKAAFGLAARRAYDNRITLREVSAAFQRSDNLIQRWYAPEAIGYGPPDNWREVLADLCERAAAARLKRAREEADALEAQAAELRDDTISDGDDHEDRNFADLHGLREPAAGDGEAGREVQRVPDGRREAARPAPVGGTGEAPPLAAPSRPPVPKPASKRGGSKGGTDG